LNNKTPKSLYFSEHLRRRIERNYADFKADMFMLEPEDVYAMAHRIAIVEDAYHQMINEDGLLDTDETIYLLKFYNPLVMIADALQDRQDGLPVEIDEALYELFDREDNEENYITVEFANELHEKYGSDVCIKIALLKETIETLQRYIKLLKLNDDDIFDYDEGVDA